MNKVAIFISEKRNWVTIGLALLLILCLSISIYGYSVGVTPNIYRVGATVITQYSVGAGTPTPSNTSSGVTLLLVAVPIELAGIILVILSLRLRASGGIKGLAFTLAMAIFLIITFIIINSFINTLR